MRLPLLFALLAFFGSAHAATPPTDIFEGCFGSASYRIRENIRGPWGRGYSGYRVTLELDRPVPQLRELSETLNRSAARRLRLERYIVQEQRVTIMDATLPASCDIWAYRDSRLAHFHAMVFTDPAGRPFLMYELNEELY